MANIGESGITNIRLLYWDFEDNNKAPDEVTTNKIISEAMIEISKLRIGSKQGKEVKYLLNYTKNKKGKYKGHIYFHSDSQDVAYMLIGFDWNGETRRVPDTTWKPPCQGEISQLRRELMYTDIWGDMYLIEERLKEVNRKVLPMIPTNEPIYKIKHGNQPFNFILAWNNDPSPSEYEGGGNILTNPKQSYNLKKIRPDQEKTLIQNIKRKYGMIINKPGFKTNYIYDKKLRRKVEVKEQYPIVNIDRRTGRLEIIYENVNDSILGLLIFDKITYNGEIIKFWYKSKKGYDNPKKKYHKYKK